jgi:hypothetical protein
VEPEFTKLASLAGVPRLAAGHHISVHSWRWALLTSAFEKASHPTMASSALLRRCQPIAAPFAKPSQRLCGRLPQASKGFGSSNAAEPKKADGQPSGPASSTDDSTIEMLEARMVGWGPGG